MSQPSSLSVEQQALVEAARPRVMKLAASIARRHRTASAEDLAQLGMVKALELVRSYDPNAGASFETFIYRTVRRVMVAACHVERREHDLGKDERESIAAFAVAAMYSTPTTPEQLFARAQEHAKLAERVRVAMARLTSEDRALVHAYACEGESLASAARRLGLEYERARYSLKLAMASLGKGLRSAA